MSKPRLTPATRRALLWVRRQLKAGRLKHARAEVTLGGDSLSPKARLKRGVIRFFSMRYWEDTIRSKSDFDVECGTVCCIGGWMEARMGRSLSENTGHILKPLTHPGGDHNFDVWQKLTPRQAVKAIDRFLDGDGHDCWDHAL